MQKKYNWEEIKLAYFESPEPYATSFLREYLKKEALSWFMLKKITWWAEEKLKIKENAFNIAKKNIEKKLGKIYTPTEEELSVWYEAVMQVFKAKAISNAQKIKKMPDGTIIIPPDINIGENTELWKIFKTERWEPTNIRDKDDFFLNSEDKDEEEVQFYLPNNWREQLWQGE